jgi:uncharacterized protein with NRDE domain
MILGKSAMAQHTYESDDPSEGTVASMCLLVVLSRVDRRAPLIVGANRDERLDRPATAVTVLRAREPRVIGGRDQVAGGTWLAVNEHGVVAGLTNRPAPDGRDPTKRSRGELPLALALHETAAQAVESFVARFKPVDYNPAWLLVGDRTSLFSLDMTGEDEPEARELPAGIHVLENLPLGMPSTKVSHVLETLGALGSEPRCETILDRLNAVLSDHTVPEVVAPDAPVAPGAPRTSGAPESRAAERPPATLAACVHADDYGTRCSTLISVPADEREPIEVRVADGSPCSAPSVDVSMLLGDRST